MKQSEAWDLVASWAEERARKMRADARKAAEAYTTGPMNSSETPYGVPWAPGADGQKITLRGKNGPTAAYAAALAVAASVIECDARAFRLRVLESNSEGSDG